MNGVERTDEVEARLLLVHYLRELRQLTGTHVGCDTSSCGACTVHLDGVGGEVVHGAGGAGRRRRRADDRGAGERRPAAPRAGGFPPMPRRPVRVLHAGHDHGGRRTPRRAPAPHRGTRCATASKATSADAPATRRSSTPCGGPPSTPDPAAARCLGVPSTADRGVMRLGAVLPHHGFGNDRARDQGSRPRDRGARVRPPGRLRPRAGRRARWPSTPPPRALRPTARVPRAVRAVRLPRRRHRVGRAGGRRPRGAAAPDRAGRQAGGRGAGALGRSSTSRSGNRLELRRVRVARSRLRAAGGDARRAGPRPARAVGATVGLVRRALPPARSGRHPAAP